MRKKLLRSRTGFEKPESREEAIMQNILGASNVLEPSESNIEEILKSILYNTPYTKEAEFEIEKILLAIKNNGTYDGKGESRDMKILIAILKDLDYTEKAESRIEELFIEWLNQRSKVKVLEGVPPLTFVAKGEPLINYEISGNTIQNGTPTPDNPIMPQSTGERTGNLFDSSTIEVGGLSPTTGAEITDNTRLRSGFISVEPSTHYGLSREITSSGSFFWVIAYDENKNIVTDATVSAQFSGVLVAGRSLTINRWTFTTTPTTKYIRWYVTADNSYKNIMLNLGSTPLPYEPYGYKIPIISAGQTNNIYIGSEPLCKAIDVSDVADTITYSTQQLIRRVDSNGYALATPTTETINVPELPTNNGTTVIDVDTTLKPSNIYIEYK